MASADSGYWKRFYAFQRGFPSARHQKGQARNRIGHSVVMQTASAGLYVEYHQPYGSEYGTIAVLVVQKLGLKDLAQLYLQLYNPIAISFMTKFTQSDRCD